MRQLRLRRWMAVPAVLVVAAPIALTQLGGVAGATITTDTVQYVQTSTSSSFSFVPGNGATPTTQAITPTGTCKTPSTSTAPIVALSALVYKSLVNKVPYTGPSSPGVVGTKSGKTGLCNGSTGGTFTQNQSLVFALGTNALVSARTMSEARIPVEVNAGDDEHSSSLGSGSAVTAVLIERQGATVVGTQSFVLSTCNKVLTLDTGQIAGGFSSVELQLLMSNPSSTSGSVVGTTVLSLLQLSQTITFTNTPPTAPVVGGSYTVTATGGGSGNPVTFSVDAASTSGCTVNSATGLVSLNGPAGTCVIDANQAGNGQYAPAPQMQQTVSVGLAPQAIMFTSTPPSSPVAGDTYGVTATGGGSGNPVVFTIDASSTSGCTVDPSTNLVTFTAPAGTCVIDANQAGNTSYLPAPQVQQSITVYNTLCGQQTISTQSTDGTAGQVSAAFTFQDYNGEPAPADVCKGYTTFDASDNNPVAGLPGLQSVTFASQPLATAHLTGTITWATDSFCTPDGSNNTPQCPTTYVSFDNGQTWQPQTYCSSAQSANIEWCTTGRTYAITPTGTQITETWDGYGDPLFHHA
jgi:hypothetical protein